MTRARGEGAEALEQLGATLDAPPWAPHPGEDELARFEAQGLAPAPAAAVSAHLEACARCRARIAGLAQERQAFLAEHPFATLPRPAREAPAPRSAEPSRGLRRVLAWLVGPSFWAGPAWAGAGALALALLVVALSPSPQPTPPGGGTRLKGERALSFVALRDGRPEEGRPGGHYRQGDRIQLRYSSPQPGYLLVVSLDGRGAVTVFYDDAGHSLPVDAGHARLLDESVELDDARGPERVLACFSETPLSSEVVLAAARRALADAGGDPAAVEQLGAPCKTAGFSIVKD